LPPKIPDDIAQVMVIATNGWYFHVLRNRADDRDELLIALGVVSECTIDAKVLGPLLHFLEPQPQRWRGVPTAAYSEAMTRNLGEM
jgi:hypothetical protein